MIKPSIQTSLPELQALQLVTNIHAKRLSVVARNVSQSASQALCIALLLPMLRTIGLRIQSIFDLVQIAFCDVVFHFKSLN